MPTRFSISFARVAPFTLAALALCAAPALAGPPLLTDDPDTLEKGKFELNTTYRLTLSPRDNTGRTWEHEAPLFDLTYGLVEGIQIKFEIPLLVIDPSSGESAQAGFGDASIGSKIRFLRDEDAGFSLSIYPAIGLPFGDRGRGLGTGNGSLTFPVQVGRHMLDGKLFVYADGGYEEQFAKGETDLWFTGLAAEYEIAEGFIILGEVRWESGVRGSSDDSLFNVGVKWKLSEHAAFIGAIGRSFNPTPDSGADLRVNVGVQWSF